MSDASSVAKSLRDRLGNNTEDRLGRALSELLENPLLTGAIGRAFDAREKASQAQEVAMGALNIPSAADIERLTRRLRAVSHRLEGIEDGVHRLDRTLAGVERSEIGQRLSAIEQQLERLTLKLEESSAASPAASPAPSAAASPSTPAAKGARKAKARKAKARKGKAAN